METIKFLVIYVYYEINGFKKNQTNLSYFIKHGVNKNNWMKINVDYLFVINGHQCEILIPNEPNIKVLREDNCMDFEGWYNGIKYLENIYNDKICNLYDNIFFINCSVLGPLISSDKNNHWILPYYDKLINENSVICSNIITSLPESDAGGPGFRCSSYCFLLKSTDNIMSLLTNNQITNKHETSTSKIKIYTNTVFGKKIDKIDCILTGEYGLSRLLLKNKYKISCLIYDQENYKNVKLNNNLHQDRYLSYDGKNLPIDNVIFYKNIWRDGNNRISLPVNYDKCKKILYENSNFKNSIIKYEIDYDNLPIQCNNLNWNSKKEFYELYGYTEEIVTFPIQKNCNTSVAIYHHFDVDNIIKEYVLDGLRCLILSGYDIYFCTSCDTINNIDLPFKIHYYKNYGAGTDLITYKNVIKDNIKMFKLKYKYLFITNDSVIFPINGVKHFNDVVNKQRNGTDFWGHWSSPEIQHHLIGILLEFKIDLLDTLLDFLTSKLDGIDFNKIEKIYYVKEIEVKILQHLLNAGFIHSTVLPYEKFNYYDHITPNYPHNIYQWINDENTFAIKWKYNCNYLNLDFINNKYLNHILRYLHFGPHGPIGIYQKITGINPDIIVEKYSNIK